MTPQRLRHTFASQMLTVGVRVTSLQYYPVHELLDMTIVSCEDPGILCEIEKYEKIY